MSAVRAAMYARVSSQAQAEAGTVASQIAEILDRSSSDGAHIPEELRFVDDGFSGAALLRPALERLRDKAAAGTNDRVYVHSPDRLARKYAYQVLLVDEFSRANVELEALDDSFYAVVLDTDSSSFPANTGSHEEVQVWRLDP